MPGKGRGSRKKSVQPMTPSEAYSKCEKELSECKQSAIILELPEQGSEFQQQESMSTIEALDKCKRDLDECKEAKARLELCLSYLEATPRNITAIVNCCMKEPLKYLSIFKVCSAAHHFLEEQVAECANKLPIADRLLVCEEERNMPLIPEEPADLKEWIVRCRTKIPVLQAKLAKCNTAVAEQEFIKCQQKQKESHAISLAFFAPDILKFSSTPWEASLEALAHAQEFYQTRWTLRHEAASNVLTSLFDESFAQKRLHSLLAQHDTLLPPPVPGRQIGFTPEQIELRNHLHEVQIPAATEAAEQAARAVTVAIEAEQAANQALVQSQRPFLDAQIGERAARAAPPQLWHSTLSAVLSVMENPHGIKYVCYSMFPESCGNTTNEVIGVINGTTPGAFLIDNQQTIWWGTWAGGHTVLITYGASPSHALRYFAFNRIKAAFDHIKPQVFTDSPALCLLDAAMDGAVNAIGAAPFGYPGMIGAAVLGSVVSGASCLAKGRISKDVGHTPYIADAAALLGVGVAVLKGGITLFGGPVGTTLFAINTVASVDHLTKLFVSTSSQETVSAPCTPITEAPQSAQTPVGEVALENHA